MIVEDNFMTNLKFFNWLCKKATEKIIEANEKKIHPFFDLSWEDIFLHKAVST